MAFLVIKGENVRVVNMDQNSAVDAVERAADLAPEILEKCVSLFKKKDTAQEEPQGPEEI